MSKPSENDIYNRIAVILKEITPINSTRAVCTAEISANNDHARISFDYDEVYTEIMAKMKQGADGYIWDSLGSVEELGRVRMTAMSNFISDFDTGRRQGRYVPASLPSLPFPDYEFDLALCSHYLFLYSDHVDEGAHLASMRELCRVASEVRVFPVISLNGETSRHLDSVMAKLSEDGIDVSLQAVSYRFQKGATEMLVAKSV